jgi:hypothetical protein
MRIGQNTNRAADRGAAQDTGKKVGVAGGRPVLDGIPTIGTGRRARLEPKDLETLKAKERTKSAAADFCGTQDRAQRCDRINAL